MFSNVFVNLSIHDLVSGAFMLPDHLSNRHVDLLVLNAQPAAPALQPAAP